jgi:hypothetical protein
MRIYSVKAQWLTAQEKDQDIEPSNKMKKPCNELTKRILQRGKGMTLVTTAFSGESPGWCHFADLELNTNPNICDLRQ